MNNISLTSHLRDDLLTTLISQIRDGEPDLSWALQTFDRIEQIDLLQHINGSVARIPLTQGQFALVDVEDLPRLKPYSWFAVRSNRTSDDFYARAKIAGKAVPMHRFLMKVDDPRVIVDHENNHTLDNRKANLRVASGTQSSQNRRAWRHRKDGSLFKGVYRNSRNSWRACIKSNGKPIHLGNFLDEREAALAYDRAALVHHGEFANLNFPEHDHG